MSTKTNQEPVTVLAVGIERGAAMVGVTSRHLRKQLDTDGGPIRTVRMGNRVLIPVESLHEYLGTRSATSQSRNAAREEKPVRRRGDAR